ncbi:MAG TPA: YgeY family selenium metabolism-linked hydrolase [Candidatus Dormibacteraeota bacterium]
MARSRTAFGTDEIADFALRMLRQQSLSGEEGKVADVIENEMRRLGLEVERDELGNVTGTLDAGPGPAILIDGHMDTVGVTNPDQYKFDPWGQRTEGRLYGRGAMDEKGPLAAALYGVASLAGRLSGGRVTVSASIAEEFVEGTALLHVAERVKPDFVIICEATSLKVARGQRGRAEIKIEVQGRATHSSRPDLGINAAQAAVDIVMALRQLEAPHHEVLGGGILVLTDLVSQPLPALSVVPHLCTAIFDRRTLPGETETGILEPIEKLMKAATAATGASAKVWINEDDFVTYTGKRVTAPNFAPAWFFEEQAPIVQAALRGVHQAGIQPELCHYAFCTNGSATAGRLGIPTIGFGPGDEERAHRIDEYVEEADLEQAHRAYAAIVEELVRVLRS